MDTITPVTRADQPAAERHSRRRSRTRRVASVVVVVTTVVATLGLTTGSASAATFSSPELYCHSGSVRVDPGVRSWFGDSDGYYRIELYKYTWLGWAHIRSAEGKTSQNQMALPGRIGFANVGSGYYAAWVERWNAQNGRWVPLASVWAQQVDPYFQRPNGVIFCQLY